MRKFHKLNPNKQRRIYDRFTHAVRSARVTHDELYRLSVAADVRRDTDSDVVLRGWRAYNRVRLLKRGFTFEDFCNWFDTAFRSEPARYPIRYIEALQADMRRAIEEYRKPFATREARQDAVRLFWSVRRGTLKATEGARVFAELFGVPVNTVRGDQNELFKDAPNKPWRSNAGAP